VNQGRFREVRQLFDAVMEARPEDRLAWLRQKCHDDHQLYTQVEDLLLADRLADQGFTLTPKVLSTLSSVAAESPRLEGRRVGQYVVDREIGHGGMGAVYLARRADHMFSKHVALKVLRPEHTDAELLRRFHQEREIVARLDHPNIARLLDGGTTEDGLPYSVMEYVDGEPIDIYCDTRRLNIPDRVEVVRTVCAAVQYAHQHLVIHRDLKPSNILVTSDGHVKLLDFGIAKLLGDQTEETFSYGAQLLTLAYASPEQIKGERIATTTDVYSLGVVLYELLTGRRPYVTSRLPLHGLPQSICELGSAPPSEAVLQPIEEGRISGRHVDIAPEQLSASRGGSPEKLARQLSGELDNIVMMALRKEPDRRYRSVEQLSDDLGRHLSGLPVLAQTDTVPYRARKFIRRHLVGVAVAATVLLSMTGAIAATGWQVRVARAERGRAERETAEALFQSRRAEQQTSEAESYRTRAEREAAFAREQLRIVELRTEEADARRREAVVERERAERRARDVHTIAAALLDVNANVPQIPSGIQAGKRAATDTERILSKISSEGVEDPSLAKDVAALRELIRRYEAIEANVTPASPAAWLFNSAHLEDYESGVDATNSVAGVAAFIRSRRAQAQGSAAMFQVIDAEPYRGKRLRVSAMLKASGVVDAAGIFVDVLNDAGKWMFDDGKWMFNTIRQLRLRGTTEWSRHAFVFDVPDNGTEVFIGFSLKGSGVIWADDFSFEVVDTSVPVTADHSKRPINLNFEEPN
jgi:serine/threonine protein kinase